MNIPNEHWITDPAAPALGDLCGRLAERADALDLLALGDSPNAWPAEQLHWCGDAGVYRWFFPIDGPANTQGLGWTPQQIAQGYLRLAEACLTTTFVITQRMGACTRIARAQHPELAARVLPDLLAGKTMATVGISHLTTSRRHLQKPVLQARADGDAMILDGYSPWVTGAPFADHFVLGAELEDGRQILACVPADAPGLHAPKPELLLAVGASQTGRVECSGVHVEPADIIAGPVVDVMQSGVGASTGGLQTSTLALGLARAALTFLSQQADIRPDLAQASEAMEQQWRAAEEHLLLLAGLDADSSPPPHCNPQTLRTEANSLALRRPSRPGRGQGRRVHSRPSGTTLVPRSSLFSRLELPAARCTGQPL